MFAPHSMVQAWELWHGYKMQIIYRVYSLSGVSFCFLCVFCLGICSGPIKGGQIYDFRPKFLRKLNHYPGHQQCQHCGVQPYPPSLAAMEMRGTPGQTKRSSKAKNKPATYSAMRRKLKQILRRPN